MPGNHASYGTPAPVALRTEGPVPSPPPGWNSWDELIRLALAEARLAEAEGEVPIGAVVVSREGRIIGRGHNTPVTDHDPTAHAEVMALRAAATTTGNYRLDGAVLVVTLEPCMMCAGAMVHSRVAGVVYGAADARAGAVTSCLDGLDQPFHNHKVWHMGGVQSQACTDILLEFFRTRR